MSVLVVDYNEISYMNSVATSLAMKFQNRVEDYEGVAKGVRSLPTSRSNLESTNYFIKKKNEQYQTKINKINLFKTKMVNFSEEAEATDKRVASRITSDTKVFKKANDISISNLAVIVDAIKTKGTSLLSIAVLGGNGLSEKEVRELKYGIKDWYRKGGNRFLVQIIKDVIIVAIIAAVVIGTISSGGALLPLLGATLGAQLCTGFALFSGACAMGYDITAGINYMSTGDRLGSKVLDKKGGSEVTGSVFGGIGYGGGTIYDNITGEKGNADIWKQRGEGFGKITFSGLEIATSVYGVTQLVLAPVKFAKTFSKFKKSTVMSGKSNWDILKKTALVKGLKKDFEIAFGAKDITSKVNISQKLFGKNNTYKKALFNLVSSGTKGITKEVYKNGLIKNSLQNKDTIKKEALKIFDIIKDMQKTPKNSAAMS